MKCLPSLKRCVQTAVLMLAAVTAAFGFSLPAMAEDFPSAVSVRAILPENQVGNATYFDLRMASGTEQTVQMQINNDGDKPIIASVELNPASTGINGTIVYRGDSALDESMLYPIGEVARVRNPVVEIPPNSNALVDIDIKMPNEAVNGIILGGLRVTADYPEGVQTTAKDDTQGQGVRIRNRFAYVIGLKLSQDASESKPDFHLKSVRPGLVNYATAVIINIQNSEPAIAKNMPFSAQIFQNGSSTVLKEISKNDAEMAPNSNCDFIVDWGKTRIQPGVYRVLVRMQHEERVWEWDEEFTVAAEEANNINSGALGMDNGPGIPIWVYIIGGLLLTLIILLIIILLRLRDRKEKEPIDP